MKKNKKNNQSRGQTEYERLFMRKAPFATRDGKMSYIRKEFHDRIVKIVQVIGDNEVTLSGYIDNILEHHFKTYEGEIIRLYDEKTKNTNLF